MFLIRKSKIHTMKRTMDFMKNTHMTSAIMVRKIPIAECFYKENHNIRLTEGPYWPFLSPMGMKGGQNPDEPTARRRFPRRQDADQPGGSRGSGHIQ